ncbi:hypothetical protein SDC9_110315 [bioreactor metagenome]|uniref:Uncharacterized protein n=1 Tax=bioreactor metagenome TaxID=1076179 RepID=A0A645BDA4_9ZZZZ
MGEGWIKLYRKLMDSPIFENERLLKVFIYCLLKSSHQERNAVIGLQTIELKKGQFVFGRKKAAAELNIPESTVWRHMKLLEKMNVLILESNNKWTVVTVGNWEKYQGVDNDSEQQMDNKRTTDEQQMDTDKNVKNVKNKDNSQKSTKRIYDVDSIHYQLAEYLFEEMKKNNPEARKPDFHKWANDIRLMMEIDNRKEEQVRNMITWSQSNDFWKGNILSAKKLRDKYDQMKVQANQPYKNNNAAAPKNDSVKYDIKQSEFFKVPEGYSFDD